MSEKIIRIIPLDFQWTTMDPFLFCVYHDDLFPQGNDKMGPNRSLSGRNIGQDFVIKDGWRMYHGEKVPGFPAHPHRGFETITVVQKGMVDHADSMGAAGRYGDGDTQWLTSGKGVQHSEMFPLLHKNKKNPLLLFQIWINLPSKHKFVDPHFTMLWSEDIPKYEFKDTSGLTTKIDVIAGALENHVPPNPPPKSWAANAENHVAVWTIEMEPGSKWIIPPSVKGVNRVLYFYKGDSIEIEGSKIQPMNGIELKADRENNLVNGPQTSSLLMLQGMPIREPVVQYGPFVMNNENEIQQAFQDFQRTQFGGWPWSDNAPIHPEASGRFAKHSDGTEEKKLNL